MEGPQPVKPDNKVGPSPIKPPTLYYPHTEGASVTGGHVYHGERLKGLAGVYVFGDYVTGKIWGAMFDGEELLWKKELAQTNVQIVSFGEDAEGEFYFLDLTKGGKIYRLAPSNPDPDRPPFPRKISETGLFADATAGELSPGVVPFEINSGQWMDGATARRCVALPGTSSATFHDGQKRMPDSLFKGRVWLPKDGVLAKTISLGRRRVETQILHFDGDNFRGYTYRWNDEQTDADLVPKDGAEAKIDGRTWRFHSRNECLQCHNPRPDYALAFNPDQLDRGGQLDRFRQLGLVDMPDDKRAKTRPLADPHGAGDLDARARSYLHANCAHCHQNGGGGTATIDLRHTLSLDRTKSVGASPVQGEFGIAQAKIIAPGDPYRSTLYYRVSKLGRGRMPHIGSDVVDPRGRMLIRDWIASLTPRPDEAESIDKLANRNGPKFQAERRKLIESLLGSAGSALRLGDEWDRLKPNVRGEVLAVAKAHPDAAVRDVFQRFIPEGERRPTLGVRIKPTSILRLTGDVKRGESLFRDVNRTQCMNCHRLGDAGKNVGPELNKIGGKLTPSELIESVLEPSKKIEPKYTTYQLELLDGRVTAGLLIERTPDSVTVRNAKGEDLAARKEDIDALTPLKTSTMPEQLFRDLTAQEAADLIAYLASLK